MKYEWFPFCPTISEKKIALSVGVLRFNSIKLGNTVHVPPNLAHLNDTVLDARINVFLYSVTPHGVYHIKIITNPLALKLPQQTRL